MKKLKISVFALVLGGISLLFSSCLGSFSLTNSVLDWNRTVGNKVVNELVFVAFWILPVYEVTTFADLFILNSIEFWSGKNLVAASQEVETEQGKYLIKSDRKGYTVTHESTGRSYRLNFNEKTQTWSFAKDDKEYPIMSYVDKNHVRMITPEGDFRIVELSEEGLSAYSKMVFGGAELQPVMANK